MATVASVLHFTDRQSLSEQQSYGFQAETGERVKGKGGCGSGRFCETHVGKGEKDGGVCQAFYCVFRTFVGDESNG